MKRVSYISRIFLLILFLCVNSCADSREIVAKKGEKDVVVNVKEITGAYGTFVVGYNRIDIRLVNEGLTRENENGEIIPGLAKSWEASNDKKTWSFYLRDNLKWSDGKNITGKEIIASFKDQIGSGNIPLERISSIHDKVIVMNFSKPVEGVESYVSNYNFVPKREEHVNYTDMNVKEVIASGPYKPVKRGEKEIILEKNPYYWNNTNIKADRIIFQEIEDNQIKVEKFKKNEIDFTEVNEDSHISEYMQSNVLSILKSKERYNVLFNPKSKIMKNINIRKAIIAALDRGEKSPRTYIPENRGIKGVKGELPEEITTSIPSYSPKEAEEFFKKGLKDENINLTELKLLDNGMNESITSQIKKDLEKNLGIKVILIKNKNTEDYDIKVYSQSVNSKDIIYYMAIPEIVSNPEYKMLYEKAKKLPSGKEQIETIIKMEKIMVEELPYFVFKYKKDNYYLVNPKLKGIKKGIFEYYFGNLYIEN